MTPRPWLVPVAALERTRGARQAEQRRGPVGSLTVAGSSVPDGAEAAADVVLDVIDGGIEVAGHVRAPWQGECRRCLRPVAGELDAPVRELYRRPGRDSDPEEEEIYPLVGDHLDLEPLVRDALLLALPLAPLCRPDCAGLCPTCGADLADGPCACDPGPVDPRWAGLDVLRQVGGLPRGAGGEPST